MSVTTADLHAQHNSQLWSVKFGMNLHSNLMGILSIESEMSALYTMLCVSNAKAIHTYFASTNFTLTSIMLLAASASRRRKSTK